MLRRTTSGSICDDTADNKQRTNSQRVAPEDQVAPDDGQDGGRRQTSRSSCQSGAGPQKGLLSLRLPVRVSVAVSCHSIDDSNNPIGGSSIIHRQGNMSGAATGWPRLTPFATPPPPSVPIPSGGFSFSQQHPIIVKWPLQIRRPVQQDERHPLWPVGGSLSSTRRVPIAVDVCGGASGWPSLQFSHKISLTIIEFKNGQEAVALCRSWRLSRRLSAGV